MPRYANVTLHPSYNIANCGACNWSDESYEETAFEYSFVVPHHVEGMIELMGGPTLCEQRVDYVFHTNISSVDIGVNGLGTTTINNSANEPDNGNSYLSNYLNKQWKSVE